MLWEKKKEDLMLKALSEEVQLLRLRRELRQRTKYWVIFAIVTTIVVMLMLLVLLRHWN